MPSSQLKRAERAIQTIRDQSELPPETADALQEIDAGGKGHLRPSAEMELPNRR
jgi:Histidine phosphatase superfamily (branch 1)